MEETSTDMEALARRAVSCKGWRWADAARGFANHKAFRVVVMDLRHPSCPAGNAVIHWDGEVNSVCYSLTSRDTLIKTALPDLSDRATLGCLEGLVADAWNAPLMYVEPCGGGFEARRFEVCNLLGRVADGFPVEAFVNVSGPTKVAALVLALEAAP